MQWLPWRLNAMASVAVGWKLYSSRIYGFLQSCQQDLELKEVSKEKTTQALVLYRGDCYNYTIIQLQLFDNYTIIRYGKTDIKGDRPH